MKDYGKGVDGGKHELLYKKNVPKFTAKKGLMSV